MGISSNIEESTPKRQNENRKSSPTIAIAEMCPEDAELLGNKIKQLNDDLHQAKSRNVYLTDLIEQQQM